MNKLKNIKVENTDFLKDGFYDLDEWLSNIMDNFYQCKNIENSHTQNKQFELLEILYKMQDEIIALSSIVNDNINAVTLKTLILNSEISD